ncbi:Hypothetical predicted protein [Pelobates cultripes]|uniref:Uncharacterized protein n=1 Tax=Pelobates cultripes TaxID=61616 RepID=A0AAD1SQJ3_PELCU|nr:Hypothetical predicted protein [Pelobates cultripes]
MEKYRREEITPRGLRFAKNPSFDQEEEDFIKEWSDLLESFSFGLIDLIIKRRKETLIKLDTEINTLKAFLTINMPPEQYTNTLEEIQINLEKLEKGVIEIKKRKYLRDKTDYARGEVRTFFKNNHNHRDRYDATRDERYEDRYKIKQYYRNEGSPSRPNRLLKQTTTPIRRKLTPKWRHLSRGGKRGTPNRNLREDKRSPKPVGIPTHREQIPTRYGNVSRDTKGTPDRHSREIKRSPEPVVRRKIQTSRSDQHPVERIPRGINNRTDWDEKKKIPTYNRFNALNTQHKEEDFCGDYMKGRYKDNRLGWGTPGKRGRSIEEEFFYKKGKKKVRE